MKKQNIRKELINYILQFTHGDTITFEEIGELLNLNIKNEDEMKYLKRRVNGVRNALIDEGYLLKTISNIGYYILTPNQVPSFTYRTYIVKPQKAYQKASRILEHTTITKLNKKGKSEYNGVCKLNNELIENTNNILDKNIQF
jgi:hypothetical protein